MTDREERQSRSNFVFLNLVVVLLNIAIEAESNLGALPMIE